MAYTQTGRGDLVSGKGGKGGTRKAGGGGGGAIDENTELDAGPIKSDAEAERTTAENLADVTMDVMENGYPGNFDSALYRMDFSPTYRNPTLKMLNDRSGSGFMITLDDVNRVQTQAYQNTPRSLHPKIRQLENVGKYKLATMWNSASPELRREFLGQLNAPERERVVTLTSKIGLVSR